MNASVYFPGLNGIRFLAAVSVIAVHIEQVKRWFGIGKWPEEEFFFARLAFDGDDAVTLFFVLSGFLITYLLLTEYRQTGEISVRNFYVRRTLRIWPLYYLIVFIGFAVLPLIIQLFHFAPYADTVGRQTDSTLVMWAYLFFLPNVTFFFGIYPMGISHLWSIGIEEQFYLIAPLIVRKFARNIAAVLLTIIAFKWVLIFVSAWVTPQVGDSRWLWYSDHVLGFLVHWRVENMAVGGLGAYLLFNNRERILNFIFHPIIEKVTLVILIGNLFLYNGRQPLMNNILSFVYIVFILNTACNPNSTLKLENRFFNALGRISYGLYMYHLVVVHIIIMALMPLGTSNSFAYNLLLYALVMGLTIGTAALSYRYFEQPFLHMKRRFASVEPIEQDKAI